ncbi:MAG: DMT family transporter [Betaproteobacteria bacterium]|nr:DMT family transporter [Betaproteobacteria bacterium]
MTQDRIVKGVALLAVTVLVWGATFPIGKDAVTRIDPYWLGALRYVVVAPLFAVVLWVVEGRRALTYEGKMGVAVLVGCVGFGGFNLFTFGGMQHTAAAHAAIIMALQAPLTAIVHWAWRGVRPARFTLVCMTLALLGVILVITKGDVASAVAGGTLFGDALVFLGASSWVAYIMGVVKFSGWSALRYTALTCIPGAIGLVAVALGVTALGVVQLPTASSIAPVGWQLAFLTFLTAFIGVLFWNNGIRLIGPLNAVLFGNLVPIVTFAIRIAQGHRFTVIELAGAVLVVGALAANNLYIRRVVTRAA